MILVPRGKSVKTVELTVFNVFRFFVEIFQEYNCMLLVGYSIGYAFLRIKKKGLDLHLSP